MSRSISSLLLVILCLFATAAPCVAWSGHVKQVINGDRLIVSSEGKEILVRLYGIDAPEYKQPFAKEATDYLIQNAMDRDVEVSEISKDHRRQFHCILKVGGKNLNQELIEAGLAWVDERYCLQEDVCADWKERMAAAKKAGRGLWGHPDPTPPWEWRWRTK